MNVIEAMLVLLALQFNQTYRNGKGRQTTYKEHKEVIVGRIFIKRDAENATPNGEESDSHHDHLRHFHQEQVVFLDGGIGLDNGHDGCR